MSAVQNAFDDNYIITDLESILISNYRIEFGTSPTLVELKQYIVSNSSEKLISILRSSNSTIFSSMPPTECLALVNIYIRKLRVL